MSYVNILHAFLVRREICSQLILLIVHTFSVHSQNIFLSADIFMY